MDHSQPRCTRQGQVNDDEHSRNSMHSAIAQKLKGDSKGGEIRSGALGIWMSALGGGF